MSRRMATDNRDLAAIAGRARLPLDVQKQGGMQRLDWILQLANPREFVQDLASEELYLMMRDIGEHDAYALMEFASDDQLASLQDLDIWSGNEVHLPRWFAWIDRALAVDQNTAMRLIQNTDDDLLQYLMLGEVAVHTNDLDLDTVPDELEIIPSPDGMFIFTAPVGSDIAQRLPSLLKLMWAQDMDRMRKICQAARFELKSALEEQMVHFRAARLSELGFPSPDEALDVFRYVSPQATKAWIEREVMVDPEGDEEDARPKVYRPPAMGAVAQDVALHGIRPPRLLAQALELLSDERRAAFGQAFTFLVNKVYMALERDLSQTDQLPDAGRRAAALTNLGLSWLANEDAEYAAALLERVWPETCFRVGHGLTMELALQARRLRARAGADRGMFLFGDPVDPMLQAVAQPIPMYLEGLDPGSDAATWRPFASLQELGVVAQRLLDADAVLTFFERQLGFSPDTLLQADLAGLAEDDRSQVRLATLLRTAVANVVLSDSVSFTPLTGEQLVAFMGRKDVWMEAVGQVLGDSATASMNAFADGSMDTLTSALGAVAVHDLDPRYARELFLVRSTS